MNLTPKHLILSLGVFFGLIVLILTLLVHFMGLGSGILMLLSPFYIGYSVSVVGAIIGFINAFVYGLILGYLFVMVYDFVEGMA